MLTIKSLSYAFIQSEPIQFVPVQGQDANKEVQSISTRRRSSVSMDAVCSSQNTSGSKG